MGVEEQFYIAYPFVVIACYKIYKKALPGVIIALAVISFIACGLISQRDPSLAFDVSPFRAFELLSGCLLALKKSPFQNDRRIASASAYVGMGVIIASMLLINDTVLFPGWIAIVPCIGTLLVIEGSETFDSLPKRMLATRPFVFVGAISYPLYLLHWPIVVFARMGHPDITTINLMMLGIVLSFALAVSLYRFVERPFKMSVNGFSRGAILAAAALSVFILAGASATVLEFDGFPKRLSPQVNKILAYNPYDYAPVWPMTSR